MILLDTDIVIDITRGNVATIQQVAGLEQVELLSISVVTKMELIRGCRNKSALEQLAGLLRRFSLLPITTEISTIADRLMEDYFLSHGLGIADAIIAATALHHSSPLLTGNTRDYRFIGGIRLLSRVTDQQGTAAPD